MWAIITVEKIGNVLQLRDIVLLVAAVFNQQREIVIEFTTRMSWIELSQLAVDGPPCCSFFGSIFDPRDRLAAVEIQCTQLNPL